MQLIGDKIAAAQGRYVIEKYNYKGSNFTHGLDILSKDETHHILEYKCEV